MTTLLYKLQPGKTAKVVCESDTSFASVLAFCDLAYAIAQRAYFKQ